MDKNKIVELWNKYSAGWTINNTATRSTKIMIKEDFIKAMNESSLLEPPVMQKIAKGILDDLINEFTPTECVAAHVFYDRLKISVRDIIDEELEKLKNIEFTNKRTFDSLTNFAEQLKERF